MFSTQPDELGRIMSGTKKPAKVRSGEGSFFPTPPDVPRALIARHPDAFGAQPRGVCRLWDPCCGRGDMARVFEEAGVEVIGTDINPRGYGEPLDVLKDDPPPGRIDAIVANPPFGILEHVVRRVVPLAPFVALMAKATFWHASTRAGLWDELQPAWVHPLRWRPDFLSLGSPQMDVLWIVWDRNAEHAGCLYDPLDRPGRREKAPPAPVLMMADTGPVLPAMENDQ